LTREHPIALVLTGPLGVGKSITGRSLAERRPGARSWTWTMRQLVVSDAAPWDGGEGLRQQRLGAVNACALASNSSLTASRPSLLMC
jgi:hypothetical protein